MYGKRGQSKNRGKRSVSKLSSPPATAITTLARAVKSIQGKMKVTGNDLYYKQLINGQNLTSDALSYNLCDYTSFSRTFGSSSDDETDNRIKHLSTKLDIYVQMANEYANTQFTAYLVSLKDDIGSFFTPSSGALSLTSDVHYTKVSTYSGLIHLNPRYFKVHRVKRFIIGNNNVSAGTATAERQSGKMDCRWSWNVRPNRIIVNPEGNWKYLSSAVDPSKNYYVLLFNDNSLLDAEFPTVTMNALHKMRTVG